MLCGEIINVLEQQSPAAYACDWDNVGLLIGSREKEVHRIYVALDATDETIEEAVNANADMLLTHHPMIFKGLKKINSDDFTGRRVIELIKKDMAYYAMHTNFDIFGMADLAAERMGLTDTAILQVTGISKEALSKVKKTEKIDLMAATAIGIGKIGSLPHEMTLEECAGYVKRVFEIEKVKVFGMPARKIQPDHLSNAGRAASAERSDTLSSSVHRVAICPGSGKSVINDALKAGVQVLITGDMDHHEGIDAVAQGMAVIDAGHYGLEKIFIPYMKEYLEKTLPELEVIPQEPKQPFFYI